MPLYNKVSSELVYDLINLGNPGLSSPITSSNTVLGTPSVIVPVDPSKSDTKINCAAKPNSFYIANTDLTFRRINLANLFKNENLEIRKYSAAAAGASPFTLFQLLADFNSKFGLALSPADVDDASFPAATDGYYPDRTSKITVPIKAGSAAFKGSFDLRWVYDKPLLQNMLAIQDLPGRLYPGGNVFDSSHKYILNSVALGYDYSAQVTNLESAAFANGVSIGNASYATQHQAVIDLLNTFTGLVFDRLPGNNGLAFSLYGAICSRYNLPNAAVPEVLATYYNSVVLLTLPTSNPWGVGSVYLCYNK